MLKVDGLSASYGDYTAVFDARFEVAAGETLALIGANGAGKTSLLHAICGLCSAQGRITLDGADMHGLTAAKRAQLGVALSPEGRRMFASLSVQENLEIGANTGRTGPWTLSSVTKLFPILGEFADRPARLLSGGQQQMVAIGRALMANPKVLLLDEVSLGLAPVVAQEVMQALAKLRTESGIATILVEQDIRRAIAASDRFLCLLEGRVVLQGASKGADLDAIGRAYFGEGTAA